VDSDPAATSAGRCPSLASASLLFLNRPKTVSRETRLDAAAGSIRTKNTEIPASFCPPSNHPPADGLAPVT